MYARFIGVGEGVRLVDAMSVLFYQLNLLSRVTSAIYFLDNAIEQKSSFD